MLTGLRNGVGRTTLTCFMGLTLAKEGYKTLIIDNNYRFCDTSNYLMVHSQHSIDDLKPFLQSGVLKKETIKSMTAKAEKNLELIAGSSLNFVDNTLNKDDLEKVQRLIENEYDFILIDQGAGLEDKETQFMQEIVDLAIIVTQPNKHEYSHFQNIVVDNLEDEAKEILEKLLAKSILVYNKVTDTTTGDYKDLNKLFNKDKIFNLTFDTNLIDFCNGYKCKINKENEKVITEIYNVIVQGNMQNDVAKTTIGRKFKSMFTLFSR